MTSVESNNFQRYYWENRTVYTHHQKKETQTFRKLKKTHTTSLLEVDHYQNALKRGEFSTAKQKIQNEKRKYFKKLKMCGS